MFYIKDRLLYFIDDTRFRRFDQPEVLGFKRIGHVMPKSSNDVFGDYYMY